MRRLSAVPLPCVVLFVAAASFLACFPKDRAPAPMPGQLTKSIDQYTGEEFFDLTHKLSWGGGAEQDRTCTGDTGCAGEHPTKHTLVRVDAVDGQDSLVATNVPKHGVIAIRALNRGELEEERYGFKADKRLEYYLVVLPGDAKAGRWLLEQLDTTKGARTLTAVGKGTYLPCNHGYVKGRINRANFYTCENSPRGDSLQKSGLMMFGGGGDPIWGNCAAGCCTAMQ